MQSKDFWKTYGRFAALLAALLVVAIVWFAAHEYHVHHGKQTGYTVREACAILTPAIAHQIGGNSLRLDALKPVSTDSTTTTYCVYRGAASSVSLVVRSPKNQTGVELNHQAFSAPPTSGQKVPGYGVAAYWSPTFADFNILQNDTWYILSVGSNTTSQRTLKQSEKLADKIAPAL